MEKQDSLRETEFCKQDNEELSRMLIRLWRVIDGLWFLAVEDKHGLSEAVEMDIEVWKKGVPVIVDIMRKLITSQGGLADVINPIKFAKDVLYPSKYEIQQLGENKFILRITDCPAQYGRKRNGKIEFPCKEMGNWYFPNYARVFNPNVAVSCIFCPPDSHPDDAWCQWQFEIS